MNNTTSFSSLFAVAAILLALLALWSQGWISHLRENKNTQAKKEVQMSATLGTLWIYIAVIVAFISLALLLAKEYWEGGIKLAEEVGLGFFITAFLMALANIFESTITLFRRVLRGGTIYDLPRGITSKEYGKPLIVKLIGIICASLLFSTLGVVFPHYWWIGLVPVWGYGIYIYVRLTK